METHNGTHNGRLSPPLFGLPFCPNGRQSIMTMVDGVASHTVIQVTPATPTLKTDPRSETALDALLDELQTFSKPSPGVPSSSSPSSSAAGAGVTAATSAKKPGNNRNFGPLMSPSSSSFAPVFMCVLSLCVTRVRDEKNGVGKRAAATQRENERHIHRSEEAFLLQPERSIDCFFRIPPAATVAVVRREESERFSLQSSHTQRKGSSLSYFRSLIEKRLI